MGIGPETAGVMTFSQRSAEQRVIFLHGWRAHRFRKQAFSIQINVLNRGHLAGTQNETRRGTEGIISAL